MRFTFPESPASFWARASGRYTFEDSPPVAGVTRPMTANFEPPIVVVDPTFRPRCLAYDESTRADRASASAASNDRPLTTREPESGPTFRCDTSTPMMEYELTLTGAMDGVG